MNDIRDIFLAAMELSNDARYAYRPPQDNSQPLALTILHPKRMKMRLLNRFTYATKRTYKRRMQLFVLNDDWINGVENRSKNVSTSNS